MLIFDLIFFKNEKIALNGCMYCFEPPPTQKTKIQQTSIEAGRTIDKWYQPGQIKMRSTSKPSMDTSSGSRDVCKPLLKMDEQSTNRINMNKSKRDQHPSHQWIGYQKVGILRGES